MRRRRTKLLMLGALLVLGASAAWWLPGSEALPALLEALEAAGPLAGAAFVLAYMAAAALAIPGSVLTLGGAFTFGFWWGLALVSLGSTLGAGAAFLSGRYLARGWIATKLEGAQRLRALDAALEADGFQVVLLTRLSPLFPYNLTNYAYGLTRVRLRDYMLGSWLGMLPGTVVYVSIGATARDLAALGAGRAQASPMRLALLGVGAAATLLVSVLLARRARAILAAREDVPDALL